MQHTTTAACKASTKPPSAFEFSLAVTQRDIYIRAQLAQIAYHHAQAAAALEVPITTFDDISAALQRSHQQVRAAHKLPGGLCPQDAAADPSPHAPMPCAGTRYAPMDGATVLPTGAARSSHARAYTHYQAEAAMAVLLRDLTTELDAAHKLLLLAQRHMFAEQRNAFCADAEADAIGSSAGATRHAERAALLARSKEFLA